MITIVLKLSADMSFVRALWNLSIVRWPLCVIWRYQDSVTVPTFETCNCCVRLHFACVPDVHITFNNSWTCLEDMRHLKMRANCLKINLKRVKLRRCGCRILLFRVKKFFLRYLLPQRTYLLGHMLYFFKQLLVKVWNSFFHNFFFYRHSLLATHLLQKVNKAFGTSLTVQDLFAYPTVAQMAKRIDELIQDGTLQSKKLVK